MTEETLEAFAINNFKEGYSCSESIVKAAIDKGLLPAEFLSCATPFSGGMASGCLCGAIAGSQIVIGYIHGKGKTELARALSKEFMDGFKNTFKTSCCRALTAGFEFHSPERKAHCVNTVQYCAKLLDEILKKNESKVS